MINIENIDDNECFKWCLVKYLNLAGRNSARITKAYKYFTKKFDFKDIKFPVKVRDIHKIEKTNSSGISVFGYENKEKHPTYVSKKCGEEKHVDLLLIRYKREKHFLLNKDLNTFMYNRTLHRRKNIFVVIVYKILLHKIYKNVVLKTALKKW